MEDLVPAIMLVGFFMFVFLILRTWSDNATRRKLAETKAALHRDLITRFGSTEELLAYLRSDAGRDLLSAPQAETPNPFKRILAGLQSGILLVAVGAALLALSQTNYYGSDGRSGFSFLGSLSFALGLGFIVSAGMSWALSRRWGLIEREENRRAAETESDVQT
jgi:hypothetical protein